MYNKYENHILSNKEKLIAESIEILGEFQN